MRHPAQAREPVPLVDVLRSGTVECSHRGSVAICEQGQIIEIHGNPDVVTPMRSTAKPFQALRLLKLGGQKRFDLSTAEIALIASSHNGEPEHVRTVRQILAKANVEESALACGTHPAYFPWITDQIYQETGHGVLPVHNNCSGKHAGMLLLCRLLGANTNGYWQLEHQVQQHILAEVAEVVGVPKEALSVGVDGCGVPTYNITLTQLARAYCRLAESAGEDSALGLVFTSMAQEPFMVAGTTRLDTDLMRNAPVVAKVGSDGIFCVAVPAKRLGIAVKMESGSEEAAGSASVKVLQDLGCLDDHAVQVLDRYLHRPVKTFTGIVVGHYVPVF